jgi:hypothetical protein
MRTLIYLTPKQASSEQPESIICRDKNNDIWIATIFSSSDIEFKANNFTTAELNQIKLVADNFRFFFDNLENNQ